MNRLLVVDDEKLARQYIKTMVGSSSIEINEILECENGEEALKILKEKTIDVLITDICMPRVNGINLIKKINEIGYNVKIIVVSSFDNFNYAVEVFSYGAREYILKPIKEEKMNKTLQKLDFELTEERRQEKLLYKIRNHYLKYFIMNNDIKLDEVKAVEEKYAHKVFSGYYVVCCSSFIDEPDEMKYKFINLKEVEGHMTFIVAADDIKELLNNEWKEYFVGVSKEYKGIINIRTAYKEATEARCEVFVKGLHYCVKESEPNEQKKYETVPEYFSEQFAQLIGTEKLENAFIKFQMILFKAHIGIIEPEKIIKLFHSILEEVNINFNNIIDFDIQSFYSLKQPFLYKNIKEYYNAFEVVIYKIRERLQLEFGDSKNKEKINTAVYYIKENYTKNLNMAVVSNYISMNYSLFSINFKQFTGVNFVDYLKTIRINKAKRMLEETDEKIVNISKMIGYDNYKHFMKTFKMICGVSPSEYRKNIQIGRGRNQ
ncbi:MULTISPECIES: response regulator [unclassified Clostridium]|uniref:response regulator transcription factor n=1 Tax=unclassified Clostridium TaxID=2614128 RepID=UPI0002979DE7|nr:MULTISPECIES: response regulator [unclassified Clostridium]EKQ50206.1 MAG: response regulator (CheY-like and AraC-type DNA-binding domain containing protein) [Clostridium sp. Maddingley MBC34-26]